MVACSIACPPYPLGLQWEVVHNDVQAADLDLLQLKHCPLSQLCISGWNIQAQVKLANPLKLQPAEVQQLLARPNLHTQAQAI